MRAICPGTFDPVTNGHLDVISRVANCFEKVIVAVAANPEKCPLFDLDERLQMLRECLDDRDDVEIVSFNTLLVDLAHQYDCEAIIKGLRAMSDFEYEFQMSQFNRQLDENVETFFVMASPQYTYLSSSGVKEVVRYGGCIEGLVPEKVISRLKDKLTDDKKARSGGKE